MGSGKRRGGLAHHHTLGVVAGKSAGTGKPGKGGTGEALLAIAPWVFLVGLLGLLSLGLQQALQTHAPAVQQTALHEAPLRASFTLDLSAADGRRYTLTGEGKEKQADKGFDAWLGEASAAHQAMPSGRIWLAEAVLLSLFGVFGWRIDINLFSFHNFLS